jgi:hypothetical protein
MKGSVIEQRAACSVVPMLHLHPSGLGSPVVHFLALQSRTNRALSSPLSNLACSSQLCGGFIADGTDTCPAQHLYEVCQRITRQGLTARFLGTGLGQIGTRGLSLRDGADEGARQHDGCSEHPHETLLTSWDFATRD